MTIFELRDNIHKIPLPTKIAKDIVINDGDDIVELVKSQMQRGVRGGVRKEEAKLGFYTPKGGWQNGNEPSSYAKFKHEMNREPGLGIADLKLTGAFYNAFYFDKNELEVSSKDSKTDSLMERYGQYIFKLTPESIEEYRPYFNSQFFETIKAYLYGKTA